VWADATTREKIGASQPSFLPAGVMAAAREKM
jgi:hypothetical protein